MKQTFYEAIIVIFVSVSLALVVNGLRPQGISLFTKSTQPSDQTKKRNKTNTIKEISIPDAIEKFKAGTALFVDSRSRYAFLQGHIKGAVNLSEQQFEEWINDFIVKTDPQTEIITYCDGLNCPLARSLAEKLFFIGFENVFYIAEGYDKWKSVSK